MRIYVAHSTGYDFRSQLYAPLKTLSSEFTFVFPHEDNTVTNSRTIIRNCDVVLAEVSYPSTGQGIELGWANDANVPIICLHQEGSKVSGALYVISDTFIRYASSEDMAQKLRTTLKEV